MADHAALDALHKDHWIHKALAKTKKGYKPPAKEPDGSAPMKETCA